MHVVVAAASRAREEKVEVVHRETGPVWGSGPLSLLSSPPVSLCEAYNNHHSSALVLGLT